MDEYVDTKGIIHTTSYAQLEFIGKYLSQKNKRKLIPNVSTSVRHFSNSLRSQIIAEYFASAKRTVLISSSKIDRKYSKMQVLQKAFINIYNRKVLMCGEINQK